MDDFSSRIVNSQASERVTKVLRSEANKERDRNGKKKERENENKENKQKFEDQVILSTASENNDNTDLHQDREQQEKKNILQPQDSAEDEENESIHVDLKA